MSSKDLRTKIGRYSTIFKMALILVNQFSADQLDKYWLEKLAISVDYRLQSKQNHMPFEPDSIEGESWTDDNDTEMLWTCLSFRFSFKFNAEKQNVFDNFPMTVAF